MKIVAVVFLTLITLFWGVANACLEYKCTKGTLVATRDSATGQIKLSCTNGGIVTPIYTPGKCRTE